jgi:hypothetical protein
MTVRRRSVVQPGKLTPAECAAWFRSTGRIHPASAWHGLIVGSRCAQDDPPCDGSCGRESRE